MGYPKGAGAGRNGKNFATLAQYFAIGKAHGQKLLQKGAGTGVQGVGGEKFRPPCPPPTLLSSYPGVAYTTLVGSSIILQGVLLPPLAHSGSTQQP